MKPFFVNMPEAPSAPFSHEAKTVEEHQKRFAAAVVPLDEQDLAELIVTDDKIRSHLFDFQNGIRMLVHRYANERKAVRISFSIRPESGFYHRVLQGMRSSEVIAFYEDLYRSVSQSITTMILVSYNDGQAEFRAAYPEGGSIVQTV